MNWAALKAAESDLGTQAGGHDGSALHGGGGGAWDWDCGWGVEVIPLQYGFFDVFVELNVSGDTDRVTLTPVPGPASVVLLVSAAVGSLLLLRRRQG